MNDITFCEMREKEVVNIIDGRKLGRILDVVFTCHGEVIGIVVPGERRFFKNISSSESLFIPWKCIKKIGEDTILVEMKGGGAEPPPSPPHHHHHGRAAVVAADID